MIKPASVVVQWGRQRNTALPDQLSKVDFRHGMLELFADNQGWYQPPGTNRSGPASPSSPPTSPLRARRITSVEETGSMITGAEIDDVFNKCECVRCCRPLGLHHIPCADIPRAYRASLPRRRTWLTLRMRAHGLVACPFIDDTSANGFLDVDESKAMIKDLQVCNLCPRLPPSMAFSDLR